MTSQDPDDPKRLLVIDDEANMRHMLSNLLQKSGYRVDTAANGARGLEMAAEQPYDFILCDVKMPKMGGMEFLQALKPRLGTATVIMMSAYGSIDIALEAMKLGAYDYISKPFKPDEVYLALRKAEERERLKQENIQLKERIRSIEKEFSFGSMVARSRNMQAVFGLAAKVAEYNTTVLITGESGTGKELIAQGIHAHSQSAARSMVAINCGGIPENLLESELFGHCKGAFTGADRDKKGLFEAANRSTLFLDEVGELPPTLQVKLLRVLQESEIRPVGSAEVRKIDVRVIAATARDLDAEICAGRFREDLFYRLNVMPIHLPPLRERSGDIPLLSRFFIQRFNSKFGKQISAIAPAAMAVLLAHPWPGNVRELENIIERAVLLAEDTVIDVDILSPNLGMPRSASGMGEDLSGYSLKVARQAIEKRLIARALQKTDGNRTRAAQLLEISHPSLLSKIKTYRLET